MTPPASSDIQRKSSPGHHDPSPGPRWLGHGGNATRNATFVVVLSTVAFAVGLQFFDTRVVWLMMLIASSIAIVLTWQARGAWLGREDLAWFGRRPVIDAFIGVATGAVFVAVTHLLYPAVSSALDISDNVRRLYLPLSAPPGRLGAIPIIMMAVLAEEIVWRGLLIWRLQQSRLSMRSPIWIAVVASLLYSIPQAFSGSWVLACVAFGCGLVWTGQRLITGSVAQPFFNHLVWSLSIILFWPLPV